MKEFTQKEVQTMANRFACLIEESKAAFKAVNLDQYTANLSSALPRKGAEFDKFSYWVQILAQTVNNWANAPRVGSSYHPTLIQNTVIAADNLAREASTILNHYQEVQSFRKTG